MYRFSRHSRRQGRSQPKYLSFKVKCVSSRPNGIFRTPIKYHIFRPCPRASLFRLSCAGLYLWCHEFRRAAGRCRCGKPPRTPAREVEDTAADGIIGAGIEGSTVRALLLRSSRTARVMAKHCAWVRRAVRPASSGQAGNLPA